MPHSSDRYAISSVFLFDELVNNFDTVMYDIRELHTRRVSHTIPTADKQRVKKFSKFHREVVFDRRKLSRIVANSEPSRTHSYMISVSVR